MVRHSRLSMNKSSTNRPIVDINTHLATLGDAGIDFGCHDGHFAVVLEDFVDAFRCSNYRHEDYFL